jgi:hypothetical protein
VADAHKNFAVSAVATAPSPATSGTSLTVTAGHGTRFPAAPFNAVVHPIGEEPTPVNAEVVRVTGISTDTLTITRAQESSVARSVIVGDRIYAAVTTKAFTDLEAVDAAAGTGSLRTLGTSSTSAAAGNDSRFSDARTPTAHKSSHAVGGSDVLLPDDLAGRWSRWRPSGSKIETFPRIYCNPVFTIVSGTLYLWALPEPLRAGVTYTSISVVSGSTALVSGTHQWFTLVNLADMKTLRTTTNDTSTAWPAQTVKTLNLSSTYTPGSNVDAYLGVMVTAATPPNLRVFTSNQFSGGLVPILGGTSSTGQTTAPADGTTMTAITAGNAVFWGYVS